MVPLSFSRSQKPMDISDPDFFTTGSNYQSSHLASQSIRIPAFNGKLPNP